jgi:hypothetical protein
MVCAVALAYALVAESTSLGCSRAEGRCTLTQQTLLRTERRELALVDLLGVREELTHLTLGRSRASGRTLLITRQGPVQLEAWATFGPAGVADMVQRYLDDRNLQDLAVAYDSRGRMASTLAILVIAGIVVFGVSFMLPTHTTGTRRPRA